MTPCKSRRSASGSRRLDKPQGCSYLPSTSWRSNRRVLAGASRLSFCPGIRPVREPGGPTQEGNDMAFRPLHDRVVVKRLEGEEKAKGGIVIPDTAKEKPQEGKVIAVGPGGRDENGKLTPLDVKAGDRVLFGKWSGTEVNIAADELLIR